MKIKNVKSGSIVLNFILFGSILILSLASNYILTSITKHSETMFKTIENQWRSGTQEKLANIEHQMMLDITENKLNVWNDIELRQWLSMNTDLFTSGEYDLDVSVINMGYSFRDWDDEFAKSVFSENKVDGELIKIFKKECNVINGIDESNEKIEQKLRLISKNIYEKYNINISQRDIFSLLKQIYFRKDSVIIDAHKPIPNDITNSYNFYKNFLQQFNAANGDDINLTDADGNNRWVEWITVPDTKLGFNNESHYNLSGDSSMGYKKLIIVVSLNTKSVLKPFVELDNGLHDLKYAIFTILIIAMVLSVLIISLIMKNNSLKGGVSCESEYTRRDNDYVNELFDIIYNKLKQIRKR